MLTNQQRAGREAAIVALTALYGTKQRAPLSVRRYWQRLESELAEDASTRQAREATRREKRAASGGAWHTAPNDDGSSPAPVEAPGDEPADA